ncbi:MAG: N-acetyl-gamma-glutamyl-phosphate reductase [Cryobacterium sp.]|nr:N-acetyl-gamma-glutamyl-phosphate reductase [Oligoflexia bacterium]
MTHKYETARSSYYSVGIVGARGYSGLELARLLLAHPFVKLTACFAVDPARFSLASELFEESANGVPTLDMSALDSPSLAQQFHTIFLATPAEISLELAPKLVKKGVNVIDLSGAFRLPANFYPQWYGFTHTATDSLAAAEYGLVPFCGPMKNRKSERSDSSKSPGTLVANPGCFVTSVLLAILPLLKKGVIDPASLVIDSKSGTTGAGKKASAALLFSEVSGECLPYKIGAHQHFPEILEAVKEYAGVQIDPHFSTSLLATPRGIISGVYARMAPGKTLEDVKSAFDHAYATYPLVRHGEIDPSKNPRLLSLKQVVGSNRVHIGYNVDASSKPSKLYLYSLLDNLLKGAASQAVENLNRLIDQPVETGLIPLPRMSSAALTQNLNPLENE